jgi:hypothetical protein
MRAGRYAVSPQRSKFSVNSPRFVDFYEFLWFRLSDDVACAAVVKLLDDVHVGRDRRPDVRAQDFQVRASVCVLCVCMPCDMTA